MKPAKTLALALLGLSLGAPCHASVYYVSDCQSGAEASCKPGSDANDGLAKAHPWQTLSKVASAIGLLQPGDQILFARGSAQSGSLSIYNKNSVAANPIVLDAYAPDWSTTAALPILNVAAGVSGLNFQDSGLANHDEGYVVRNMNIRGGLSSSSGGTGVFLFNDVDHVLLENLEISGFAIGVNCAASHAAENPQTSDAKNDYITLRGSFIHDNGVQGYYNGGCGHVLVANNIFDNNGFAGPLLSHNHNIYIGDSGQDVTVSSNVLTRSAVGNGVCQGDPIVSHGQQVGLVIENNLIDESTGAGDGCYGIQVNPGYPAAENLGGSVIRGNTIVNVGGNGIAVGACPDCVIENNKIVQMLPRNFYGITMPTENIQAGTDAADQHLTVRNNTIYIAGGTASSVGIQVGTYGSQHVVVSNLVYLGNGSVAGTACFSTLGLAAERFTAFDYNLCFDAGSGGRYSRDYATLVQAGQAGFDRHGIARDPLFVRLPRAENHWSTALDPKSPTIGAGHPTLSIVPATPNIGQTKL